MGLRRVCVCMERLDNSTMRETAVTPSMYRVAMSPIGSLIGVLSRASQPFALATQAAATLSASAALFGDAMQTIAPLLQQHLSATVRASPRKSMAPGYRVPMEIRSLDGTDYRIILVSPVIWRIWDACLEAP